ncbi:MAG: TonB-dependent receptor, partial [Desulfatitalea sp.]|nr:TonB-dependent receptor [Desulfatitalea sp.]NNK02838.1 TonB-dependent receptor [Desulfatitalea sp.]
MEFSKVWIAILCIVLSGPVLTSDSARAEETKRSWVGKIASLQGQAFVKRNGAVDWQPTFLNDTLNPGDILRVGPDSRAALVLSNASVLRVDQYTTLVFHGVETKKRFLMELLQGAIYLFSRKARSLKVATPFVNGVVQGTEFYVRVDDDKANIILFEGSVLAQNPYGEVILTRDQAVVAAAGQAPRLQTVVRPTDAVQWLLYYPPIIAYKAENFPVQDPADWRTKLHRSIRAWNQGDTEQAFTALQGVEEAIDDPRFYAYRAGLHLCVGRTHKAKQDIDKALGLDPTDSAALALRAVMGVVQNRKTDALKDAQAAVKSDPQSAAARTALSYALQSRFDIDAALAQMQSAVAAEPDNGLAWARLAELYLANGDLDRALAAARKAAALCPSLAHVQTVLGYAYLTQIKIPEARKAFEKAITLDSAAPLPRLGLGLAQIRGGDLHTGRAEIEIAVGLDPRNALLRSYLGKAYFDEKREELDTRQFEMAKQLDPNDPTPWFYDAIRKQTHNRPGEALQDMQKAIELNDYRAVYRSRLLLDEDLASRSAGLGRIYNDLSFEELALRQGWKSLETDPANHSAHRLLADMYASRPRHEIARVSELLQAQLLQPLNLTPVQPQLAETHPLLLTGSGPAGLGMNEFSPLFVTDRISVQATGEMAEQSTWGDELTLSGLQRWFSFSLGQSHYQSDGFRENNDLDSDIYNAFVQAAVSPKLGLQAEYRYKASDYGDLRLRLNPTPLPNRRHREKQTSLRLGLNYTPTSHHHLLCSLIMNKIDSQFNDMYGFVDFYKSTAPEAKSGEIQYIWRGKRQNIIVGAGHLEKDWTRDITLIPILPIPLESPPPTPISRKHSNTYLYYHFNINPIFAFTLAGAYDHFDQRGERPVEEQRLSPKAGVVWIPNPAVTLRAAWFKAIKRPFVANQTLEPTQIAGFNQFFDDIDGARSESYGAGIDVKMTNSIQGGLEHMRRVLESPGTDDSAMNTVYLDADEGLD